VSGSGLDVDSLDVNEGAGLLGLGDSGVVGDDSVKETLSRLGVSDVLNSEVDSLGDDSSVVLLVDDNTDGLSRDVEHSTGGSVVDLVGHTLLEGTITLDVDDVSLVVVGEVGLQANDSLLSEVLGEHVSGTPTSTFRVGHFVRFSIC